ncbi:MAG: septal ring lytic transglycosylase RlpA family protein [Gammaproteobacteria bacterium]
MTTLKYIFAVIMLLSIAACGGLDKRDGPGYQQKAVRAQPIVPKKEPLSKYGNPESYVVFGKRYRTLKTAAGFKEKGIASWYGKKFHGRKTSSGEVYDMYKMTAAHKHLPLPTFVRVRNLENGKEITVRVNDRGPFHDNRIIDLSYAAASQLGIVNSGTGRVEIEAIDAGTTFYAQPTIPASNRSAREHVQSDEDKTTADQVEVFAEALFNEETSIEKLIGAEMAKSASQAIPDVVRYKYLQIGAFKDLGNAEIALARIIRFIPMARIQEALAAGVPVYRVQIGPISNTIEADNYLAQLSALGFSDHHFVSP